MLEKQLPQTPTNKLPKFNPKYLIGRENDRPVFDLPRLFGDCMEMGKSYLEGDIRKRICEAANILTNKMYNEVFQNAVSQKVIFRDEKQPDKMAYFRPILQEYIQFS